MANVAAVTQAAETFMTSVDPAAKVALLLEASELITLHVGLEVLQEGAEKASSAPAPHGPFTTLRAKVLRVLQEGGYKGPEVEIKKSVSGSPQTS